MGINRRLKREEDRYRKEIDWIEPTFLIHLFLESNYTYKDLFRYFNKKYVKATKKRNKSQRNFVINTRYFYDKYKPEERAIKPRFMSILSFRKRTGLN
jgi:hypothetical protein